MKKLLERLKTCTENATERTIFERLACLVEECGEIATALLVKEGRKRRELKEDAKCECVDTVITALCIFYNLGGTHKELKETMKVKLEKWERKAKEIRESKE